MAKFEFIKNSFRIDLSMVIEVMKKGRREGERCRGKPDNAGFSKQLFRPYF